MEIKCEKRDEGVLTACILLDMPRRFFVCGGHLMQRR